MPQSKKEVSASAYKALVLKLANLKETTKELRSECRSLRKQVKRLEQSRSSWKLKAKNRRIEYSCLKKKFVQDNRLIKPRRHHYATWLIKLVVLLRIYCNCSLW